MDLKEFAKKSLLKPWDIVIIVLLIVLSFLPIVIFGLQQADAAPDREAVLRVDGTEIKTFPLVSGKESYTYTYKDSHGDYNLIEVDGDRIRIKEADCDDQICVRRGWAAKNGETIVCLPHKLVIEVRSTDGSDEDSLIY
ncbi:MULTISPECIES: NusG domain II-containing protein [unclassified Enterococcus]|uniref:NusG domain II-containing protein n=1 Tax=unclassified Enterococcus TaxID=2608891 RepID=UPI0013EC50E7|nr:MULTISPECIES: NusG domain II-containing protein [unclassified Enterococcus]